ncbi:uncharacterized protein A1O5_11254 [Cladophialophora psammophila CBS 110553]|uniref:Uncharacterized protein n=1 Tax=Cladophialophora psammophila CBS 110553 TaxID=1182543 RepID=W9WM56_9EURO|nr:uncharacterized protein A1O5_11254 [Cladophialophora psammophila CBS 110553]EXJ65726.1 hypothetical protein A1O5_11254 [Cladophialophora psammophila CBS 110553]
MSGDSGHGFKMMPIVGQWAVKLLENGQQVLPRWQWKQSQDKEGKQWGDEVSWRIGTTGEVEEILTEHERVVKGRL